VRALDFYTLGNQEVLVMEFFAGASISRALQKMTRKRIADGPAQNVFRALLKALSYMHSRGFVHRDVKPDNVLVSEDFKDLMLVDFNLACPSSDLTSFSCAGTEFYAAPEVVVGAPPTEANDVWGAGVCLHLMLSGRAPELCGTPAGSADGLLEVPLIGARWANVSDGAKSAVHHCLALQREFRQTASGMLEHPWVHASQPAASGTKLHQASKFYSI
jgi:serine/threonine protein kinase